MTAATTRPTFVIADPDRDARNRMLGSRSLAGDSEARRMLIDENRGLAYKIAGQRPKGTRRTFGETFSEAFVGLIEAADTYDPSRSAFTTHATRIIRFRLFRSAVDPLVAIPTRFRTRSRRPQDERFRADLDAALAGVESLRPWGAVLADHRPGPSEEAEWRDLLAALPRHLARLSPVHRRVIVLRFGLDGGGERTLRQVGAELGFTKMTAKTRERDALVKLREIMAGKARESA